MEINPGDRRPDRGLAAPVVEIDGDIVDIDGVDPDR